MSRAGRALRPWLDRHIRIKKLAAYIVGTAAFPCIWVSDRMQGIDPPARLRDAYAEIKEWS